MMEGFENLEIVHLPPRFISKDEPVYNEIYDELRTDDYIVPIHNSGHEQQKIPDKSTKHNKHVLFSIIGGCLLTSVVLVPAIYFLTKLHYETNMTEESQTFDKKISLKFDQSTLHHAVFLSEDGLQDSNTYSRDTPVSSVRNPNTLSIYKGVIGNRCFDKNRKIYFEVQYNFHVTGVFTLNDHILEVGLAERERVDNYYYVGKTLTRGWAFYLYICGDATEHICLAAEHNSKNESFRMHHRSYRSKYSGKFGFIVNSKQEIFTIVLHSGNNASKVFQFQHVYSTQRLCPVFGVHNPDKFEVKLALSNMYDFSEAVWNTVFI